MSIPNVLEAEVQDELVVLREIYQADYEEMRPSWSDLDKYADIWGQPTFTIKVKPLAISVSHRFTQAELKFTLRKGYPKVAPAIEFLSVTGLTTAECDNMKVQVVARSLQEAKDGQVMIFCLCSIVEEYLSDHNKDIEPNLFETMKKREQEEKDNLIRLRQEVSSILIIFYLLPLCLQPVRRNPPP